MKRAGEMMVTDESLTSDERWIISEAAKPCGFSPNELSVKEFAVSLVRRGWLREANFHHPIWFATAEGRAKLKEK